ncbi:MAG: dihydrofolate reductase [Verrucomicrobiales bacterium]|nr:dihydrofolate reductase [Verrucomicrobiales bacterium]
MAMMKLKAIVAMSSNRVIGLDADLPWNLPEDLRWFKKLTMGHPIVMGRKTMDSIGKPLPGRRNIVVSRSLDEAPDGYDLIHDAGNVREELAEEDVVFLIGGAEIYRILLPDCDEVYLTYVFREYDGDTFLPPFEEDFELAEVMDRTEEFELRRYESKS